MEVSEKIYNIELVVEDIKKEPQTYLTILKNEKKNSTLQHILRTKINKLINYGQVFKTTIPGTRFGLVLLYTMPKNYFILVESDRLGSLVYYFFEYEKVSLYYIKVQKYWVLEEDKWVEKNEEKTFFEGKILKFI